MNIPLAATAATASGSAAVAFGTSPPPPVFPTSGLGGSSVPADLMGTSPTITTTLNDATTTSVRGADEDYFMYQASDGTWVFLHPTCLRCVLHHFKSFEACPANLRLPILELEDVVQVRASGWVED